jgi:hypothetical protein
MLNVSKPLKEISKNLVSVLKVKLVNFTITIWIKMKQI